MIKLFLTKLYNSVVFFGYLDKCEKCGYPKEVGRPWMYNEETGEVDPSLYYQCTCFEDVSD